MTDMPELKPIPDAVLDAHHPATAPLTPTEAMARCPQVAEMASAVDDYMHNRGASEHARRLAAALAPFTKVSDK